VESAITVNVSSLSLIYILVTKKTPTTVPVPGNANTSASRPPSRATSLANTQTTGEKRKGEPQILGSSIPTEDTDQASLPPKKKMKATVERSQPSESSMTTAIDRNARSAPSNVNTKRIDNASKKRTTADGSDDASVKVNPAHPSKKAKVNKQTALTKPPIRRTGEIILMLNDT